MTTPLTIASGRRPDGVTVLTVVGEIDLSNHDSLGTAIEAADGPVLVDLTGVEYLDSAGLSVLFRYSERIEVVATPLLAPVLGVSGLAELTTVHQIGPAD
jgi:anti-sigma B factor antagonist